MTTEEIRKRLNLPESAKAAQEEGMRSQELINAGLKRRPVTPKEFCDQVDRLRSESQRKPKR